MFEKDTIDIKLMMYLLFPSIFNAYTSKLQKLTMHFLFLF